MQIGDFKRVFQAIEDNCTVISIFGSQSSGKSTLLNFLFGADFAVGEERCTRGLYGTYFRISDSQTNHSSSILVIDTEGLFAVGKNKNEKDRNQIDKKIVLFCLAISDYTIVNVRGSVDQHTETILSMCYDKIEGLNG
jgi:GTPase Era involved in 16S rRNA processing